MNQTIETIVNRKSIRAYSKKAISRANKNMIIKAAMRAPTAGNMMLYSIIDIDNENTMKTLAKTCDNQPFIARAQWILLFLADFQRWYDYFKLCKVEDMCKKMSVPFKRPSEADLLLACCDGLIAAQNAVIAAESLGIGSCYIGDIMEQYEKHRKLFSLPQYTFPIALVCFGYPNQSQRERKQLMRFDQKYIVFHNKYYTLSDDDFKDMYTPMQKTYFPDRNFIEGASNIGQHIYLKKIGSSFSQEMTRSVKAALECWLK